MEILLRQHYKSHNLFITVNLLIFPVRDLTKSLAGFIISINKQLKIMVTVNGETFPVSSIVRIEGIYIYTDNYMKLCPTKEEMEEILEKM